VGPRIGASKDEEEMSVDDTSLEAGREVGRKRTSLSGAPSRPHSDATRKSLKHSQGEGVSIGTGAAVIRRSPRDRKKKQNLGRAKRMPDVAAFLHRDSSGVPRSEKFRQRSMNLWWAVSEQMVGNRASPGGVPGTKENGRTTGLAGYRDPGNTDKGKRKGRTMRSARGSHGT